ncbi:MAG: tRNA uridine-5-carboxymethylaminomethyl(34) synthesis GTPase MnmE [bacterium]|nr:tRNA uridine-5-carboxymethylaminomethyl(34) synthesis GTPase MnmE [bacterium]
MPIQHDTICAVATPPGTAGLAVIRVSGAHAIAMCNELFRSKAPLTEAKDHTIHYGWWSTATVRIDAVTVMIYRSPNSYTGEDVIEIGCHGGHHVIQQILESLLQQNARLAEPGEFTKRAFLNGKMDLTQVEAVGDIIHSQSRLGAQTAARQLAGGFTKRLEEFREALLHATGLLELELDFSEENIEFVSKPELRRIITGLMELASTLASSAQAAEVLRSGFVCAIVGYPNAGKSSLFNALLQRERAIVSPLPGTTRDFLTEPLFVQGYSLLLHDTAGIRSTLDSIELQGIYLTTSLIEQSNLILVVNDITQGLGHSASLVDDIQQRFPTSTVLLIHNKFDAVHPTSHVADGNASATLFCSATEGLGLDDLRSELLTQVRASTEGIQDVLVNRRQAILLGQMAQHLGSAIAAIDTGLDNDCIAVDIRSALRLLGEINGETWSPDVLDAVFSRFCIGK